MYHTYTGNRISPDGGCPSLEDIAWQLMHVIRYAGACRVNYPVGIHSMMVADLVPKHLEFKGLFHDGTDSCVGDIPKPFKSSQMKHIEEVLMNRIWDQFGFASPTEEEHKLIKKADIEVLCAEADLVAPPGLVEDGKRLGWYAHNSDHVEMLRDYLNKYKVSAWGIGKGDLAVWDFTARARRCIEQQQKNRTTVEFARQYAARETETTRADSF